MRLIARAGQRRWRGMTDSFVRFLIRLLFLATTLLGLGAIASAALEYCWESDAESSAYNRCRAHTQEATLRVRFIAAATIPPVIDECKVRARVALLEARELYWHLPFTFASIPVIALCGSAMVLVWLAGGFDVTREYHEIPGHPDLCAIDGLIGQRLMGQRLGTPPLAVDLAGTSDL